MKLKLTYCFLIFVFCIKGQSQVRFSYQYPLLNSAGFSNTIFALGGNYTLFGISNNTLTSQQYGTSNVYTDLNGNLLYQKQFFHPAGYYLNSNNIRMFDKINSNHILFTGLSVIGLDHFRSTLVKFNANTGDTLWLKTYIQVGDSSQLLNSTTIADSSIISFGFKYYIIGANEYSKPFMMKVDKNGNYKWHKWINASYTTTEYLFQKIIKISDNDFIVIGNKQPDVCHPQAFVMRIDTNTVQQYNVNFNGFTNPIVEDAIVLNDGNILAVGGYISLNPCNVNPNKYRKMAYKINPLNGLKILSKAYNIQANSDGAFCVQQQTNGIIYVGGGYYRPKRR